MDTNRIRQLLVRYFEGATTLEEERTLRDYFTGDQPVEEDLIPFRDQFNLFDETLISQAESDALQAKIMNRILSMEADGEVKTSKMSLKRLMMAASVAAAIGLSVLLITRFQNSEVKDTYADPQLAYQETQKALLYISQKMNHGLEPLNNVSKINTGADQLRNIGKMDESLGMLNLVSIINQSSNMKK
ncbi:MAG: hypothetical protein JW830_08640 [Bacteroidales bacterium]|nr:hypothetical protein [Bacteroidales bacterium]